MYDVKDGEFMKKIISLLIVLMMSGGIALDTYAKCAGERALSTDYKVIIANNTSKTMHWHLETSGEELCSKGETTGTVSR